MSEFFQLFWLNFKVGIHNMIEFFKVIYRYYPHLSFLKIDTSLLFSYLFHHPFRVSKQFLRSRGELDIYTYGETPLTTLEEIAKTCQISSQDTLFELGCGRGRSCFWLNQFIGCRVVGVDYVPMFIQRANRIKERFHLQEVEFRLEDLFTTDLTGATVIYLYGTCLEDHLIKQLINRFRHLPAGTKIITVSYSLLDYAPTAPFHLVKTFSATFTWGVTDVYLQIVNSQNSSG
jgi:SAM-dependent methyltransferase